MDSFMKKMLVILLLSNIFIFSTVKPAAAAGAGANAKAINENRIRRLFDFCADGFHHHYDRENNVGLLRHDKNQACPNYGYNDYCQGTDPDACFANILKNSDDINYQIDEDTRAKCGIPEDMRGASPLHVVICGPRYLDYINDYNDITFTCLELLFDGRAAADKLAKVNLNGPEAKRRVEMVNILLSNPRINVNLQDDNGNTPLILAARFDLLSTECRNQIISLLLAAGADITIKNNRGLCFLDYVPLLDVARGNNNLRTVYEVLKGQNVTAAYHQKTIHALNEESNSIPPEILEEISAYAVGLPALDASNSSK